MSDYIPFEIQLEIIKTLPVKSLMRFRSVSKRLKSLIDSSEFVAGYSARYTQPERNLVWYQYLLSAEGEKYVSVVDDETLTLTPQRTKATVLGFTTLPFYLRVVGSSQGLWCLHNYFRLEYESRNDLAVLWNPSIRKSVVIGVPCCKSNRGFKSVLGFGVCPINNEAMIVKITHDTLFLKRKYKRRASSPWKVKIFTLSKGSWRKKSSNLPNKLFTVTWNQVARDKFIYWFAYDGIEDDSRVGAKKFILSFDMISKEFSVIDLPDSFAGRVFSDFSISKVGESLVVLERRAYKVGVVWMMNHDVENTFLKLFTIDKPFASMTIMGSTKSGQPIIRVLELVDGFRPVEAIVVYEPSSKDISYIQFGGNYESYYIGSNMETLLLHNKWSWTCKKDERGMSRKGGYIRQLIL